jgi:hypothetical protein
VRKRIVRVEDGYWRIRSEKRELRATEHRELIEYFDEIRFPYEVINGRVRVPESVDVQDIFERLEHFYEGRAEVLPF